MKVEFIKEHEDGSASFSIDMNDEETSAFIRLGLIAALEQGVKDAEKYIGETGE
ncbi:hypothetical protein UFOVP371_13 [uncultured Caudovirales phage]|uniref:Uncharacterized protein n=1 Tax=uncultured Caudovirales phage TaxID=2100421 RepID=A0A6J7X014_9CAUD|nr:hypothetical protein UFOVP371_13 [uncultured Caudovirales phage]